MEYEQVNADVLRNQYGDDVRLTARQSLWGLRTGPSLYETVLDLAALDGTETIVEVGCGNGRYLAELSQRGHTGPILGLDLSEALARQAGLHPAGSPVAGPPTATAVADAQALPLVNDGVDIALCLHMLYHVPDFDRAIAELRRVVRPEGRVLVATNGPAHTAEIKVVLAQAAAEVAGIDVATIDADQWDVRRFLIAQARASLPLSFDTVIEHGAGDRLLVTDPAILSGYVASWPPQTVGLQAGPTWDAVLSNAHDLFAAHIATHASFTVTSEVAVFVCR